MERAQLRNLTRCGASIVALAAVALLALCAACRNPERSFGALLAKIDSAPEPVGVEVFINAAALARSTDERLRLLKRAASRDASLYAETARAVIAAGNVSEPVALAAFDAFLEASLAGEALTLFDSALDASLRPAEYAEALIVAIRNGVAVDPSLERLVACADVTGDNRFLLYAAIEAMVDGDRASALTLLGDAFNADTETRPDIPYSLLWDAGALDILLNFAADPFDPLATAVCADAEYLEGHEAAASASYAYLVERFPSWSWKPYAALARLAAAQPDETALDWPHAPSPDSWTALSSAPSMAGRLYDLVAERFPDSSEASLDRARWLRSRERFGEAREVLARLKGEAADITMLEYEPLERAVPAALRLASEYPLSPQATDAALATLVKAGAWNRFEELAEKAWSAGLNPRRDWFWRAVALALSGDASDAASIIRMYGPESAGYAGVYDLGILELAAHRPEASTEAFVIAAGLARNPSERSAAFVMAGDALRMSRRLEQARSAYEAAIGADPASRDARSRLMRLGVYD